MLLLNFHVIINFNKGQKISKYLMSNPFQQFNNLGKHLKGFSLSSALLLGLGYLALNSYYYGTSNIR